MDQQSPIREGNDPGWDLKDQGVGPEGHLFTSSSPTRSHLPETLLEVPRPPLLTWGNVDVETESILRTIYAARPAEVWQGYASAWRVWVGFCRVHGVDPDAPADQDVVAFLMARVLAGTSWSTVSHGLDSIGLGLGEACGGGVLIPARRLLVDLFDDGWFSPEWQAPVLSVGEVLGMVEAAGSLRDQFLVAATYLAGLRPGEWRGVSVSDVHVTRDNRVQVRFPWAKTGRWQKIEVDPLPGLSLDLAPLLGALLESLARSYGPLLESSRGPAGQELSSARVSRILIQAAADAGVSGFSPYSLRRSMAVHANMLGVPGPVVRNRLRHSGDSQMWRRYIDPLLGLLADEDLNPWLSTARPEGGPLDVSAVTGGQARVLPYAMAAGSVDELLEGVDLPSLRVHPDLVTTSRGSLEAGEQTRRRFLEFQRQQGRAGVDVKAADVLAWLRSLVDRPDSPVLPSTGLSYLASLEMGWLVVSSEPLPGAKLARTWLAARDLQERRERTVGVAGRKKSRVAEAGEGLAVVEAAWGRVPDQPPLEWAVQVLGVETGAKVSVAVMHLSEAAAILLVDGCERVEVREAPVGLLCPVLAATVVASEVGMGKAASVPKTGVSRAEAVRAAATFTRRLNAALMVTLLVGSGCRPSDLARASIDGVQEWPSALVITQSKSKGKRPRAMGRRRYILAPARKGVMSPHRAWQMWSAWWPVEDGGFVFRFDPGALNDVHPRPYLKAAGKVAGAVSRAIEKAGLPPGLAPYGFRYERAQCLHDGGLSLEAIADVLGHDDINTTLGYITRVDPFADGVAELDARHVVETLAAMDELDVEVDDDAA